MAERTFLLELTGPEHIERAAGCPDPGAFDTELDDVRSVLGALCEVLASVDGISFVAQGFDDAPWRATVGTDLAVALEQLPRTIQSLRARQVTELEFYEQTLERAVDFSCKGDWVHLSCRSWASGWTPRRATEEIPHAQALGMLEDLRDSFIRLSRRACPELAAHPWIVEWMAATRED